MTKTTSREAATAAARTLADPEAKPDAKSAAGSALSQVETDPPTEPGTEPVERDPDTDTFAFVTMGDRVEATLKRVVDDADQPTGKRIVKVSAFYPTTINDTEDHRKSVRDLLRRSLAVAWDAPVPVQGQKQPERAPQKVGK